MVKNHAWLFFEIRRNGSLPPGDRCRLVRQFQELGEIRGHLSADNTDAESVLGQSPADLRCNALLVNFLPKVVLRLHIVKGNSRGEDIQNDGIRGHWRRRQCRFRLPLVDLPTPRAQTNGYGQKQGNRKGTPLKTNGAACNRPGSSL